MVLQNEGLAPLVLFATAATITEAKTVERHHDRLHARALGAHAQDADAKWHLQVWVGWAQSPYDSPVGPAGPLLSQQCGGGDAARVAVLILMYLVLPPGW